MIFPKCFQKLTELAQPWWRDFCGLLSEYTKELQKSSMVKTDRIFDFRDMALLMTFFSFSKKYNLKTN